MVLMALFLSWCKSCHSYSAMETSWKRESLFVVRKRWSTMGLQDNPPVWSLWWIWTVCDAILSISVYIFMYAYIYVKSFCNHGNMVTMSFSTSQPDSQKQSKLESAVWILHSNCFTSSPWYYYNLWFMWGQIILIELTMNHFCMSYLQNQIH